MYKYESKAIHWLVFVWKSTPFRRSKSRLCWKKCKNSAAYLTRVILSFSAAAHASLLWAAQARTLVPYITHCKTQNLNVKHLKLYCKRNFHIAVRDIHKLHSGFPYVWLVIEKARYPVTKSRWRWADASVPSGSGAWSPTWTSPFST